MRRLIIGGCPLEFPDEPELNKNFTEFEEKALTRVDQAAKIGIDLAAAGKDQSAITVFKDKKIEAIYPHRGYLLARFPLGWMLHVRDTMLLERGKVNRSYHSFTVFSCDSNIDDEEEYIWRNLEQLSPNNRQYYFLSDLPLSNFRLFQCYYRKTEAGGVLRSEEGRIWVSETPEIFLV